jgi:uncharacterized protein (DUF2249 family)/quercetin dioxygenase-like cupin family protein
MGEHEVDVRTLRKPDKHPAIFQAYAAIPAGDSLVLVNDHDPRHLHDEFEIEYPGGYAWEYVAKEPRYWRIRITKLASTPLPRVLADTTVLAAPDAVAADAGAARVAWKLQMRERDLDSNVITLAPGAAIAAHDGPDLDVLIYVVSGSGQLATELGALELRPGALVWLPRRSRREFTAGAGGLMYLTVHQRRQALTLTPRG